MVQTGMAVLPVALRSNISATQRRFRSHTPKPYSAPQRLIAPAKGYRAVQARKLLQEIDRLEGTRFSHVTIQPRVPSKYSPAYLRAMGALTPDSISTSKAAKFFKKGLENQLSSFTSAFGWAPVEWPGSILFIDLANCAGCLNVRNLDKSVKAYRSTLSDLKRFSQRRGCRIHVMVYVLLPRHYLIPFSVSWDHTCPIYPSWDYADSFSKGRTSTIHDGTKRHTRDPCSASQAKGHR